MRLAIVLRGISYIDIRGKDNIPEHNLKIPYTDYRVCLPLFRENLIAELSKIFEYIDIYIVTYDNDLIQQIKYDFNVKDCIIYDRDKIFGFFNSESLSNMMIDGYNLFKKNNIEGKYTHCLLTRPDLYFYRKFNLNKIDLNKINFGWTHDGNHNCDNFILTPSKSVDEMIESLRKSKYPHILQHYFPSDNINFISRPISSIGEKVQADFYIIFRNIEKFKKGEFILD